MSVIFLQCVFNSNPNLNPNPNPNPYHENNLTLTLTLNHTQISEKQRADPSLYDSSSFNWYEITEGKVDFSLRVTQADYLRREEVLETKQLGLKLFAERLLDPLTRRLLVIQSSLNSVVTPLPLTFTGPGSEEKIVTVKQASDIHSYGSVIVPR
jgi:hypothetical protein